MDGGLGGEKNIKLNRILKRKKENKQLELVQDKIIMNEILIKTQAGWIRLLAAQKVIKC